MLEQTIKIIKSAGYLIKSFKDNNKLSIMTKTDGSVVTCADLESEKIIMEQIYSNFGNNSIILSEESISNNIIPSINDGDKFWLVDPIDSTLSYVNGLTDYCINITYLEYRQPIMALIYAPEKDTLWYAIKDKGAFVQKQEEPPRKISCRVIPNEAVAVTSKEGNYLTEEIVKKYNITQKIIVSSAIKFTYIAEGKADYYFRKRNKACEWDIASGILIIQEAGGSIEYIDESNFSFGHVPFLAPSLIAKGKQS